MDLRGWMLVVSGAVVACAPLPAVEELADDGGDDTTSETSAAVPGTSATPTSSTTEGGDDGDGLPTCWEWLANESSSVYGVSATQDGGVIAVGTDELLSISAFDPGGTMAWETTYDAGVYHHVIALPSGGSAALGFTRAGDANGAIHFWSDAGALTATVAEAPTLAGLYSTGMWWDAPQELLAFGYEPSSSSIPPVLIAVDTSGALTRELDLDGFDWIYALAPLGDGFVACGSEPGADGQSQWRLTAYDAAIEAQWTVTGEDTGSFYCADVATDGVSRSVAAIAWEGPGPMYFDSGGVLVVSMLDDAQEWSWSADSFPTVVGGVELADDGTAYVASASLTTTVDEIGRDGSAERIIDVTGSGFLRMPDEISLHDGRLFMGGMDFTEYGLGGFVTCWDVGA